MSYRPGFSMLLTILFFATSTSLVYAIYGDTQLPPYIADGNQPVVAPPQSPWTYAPNVLPKTLNPGDHTWIGSNNVPDPQRYKSFTIKVPGLTEGDLKGKSVCGYDPNGGTVTGELGNGLDGAVIKSSDGTTFWCCRAYFWEQPAFEMIKIKNEGPNTINLDNIIVEYACYKPFTFGNNYFLESATFGNADYPHQITQMWLSHEFLALDEFAGPQLHLSVPGDVWIYEYTNIEPGTERSVPQGAWLWTCLYGDGIAAEEFFNISVTLRECSPSGGWSLYAYDELHDEWLIFYLSSGERIAVSPDITGDCKINFYDLAAFAAEWMRDAY
jgi:hypothetical protein